MMVISGGQTGADIAGVKAARRLGIPTGGMMPRGFKTEAGKRPEYKTIYNMVEHEVEDYGTRTAANVLTADGTIIFGNVFSPGSRLTRRLCASLEKPCLLIDRAVVYPVETIREWLRRYHIHTVNIAGNRESTAPGIEKWVYAILLEALRVHT